MCSFSFWNVHGACLANFILALESLDKWGTHFLVFSRFYPRMLFLVNKTVFLVGTSWFYWQSNRRKRLNRYRLCFVVIDNFLSTPWILFLFSQEDKFARNKNFESTRQLFKPNENTKETFAILKRWKYFFRSFRFIWMHLNKFDDLWNHDYLSIFSFWKVIRGQILVKPNFT